MLIGNQIQHVLTKMVDNKKKIYTKIAGYTKSNGNEKDKIFYHFQVVITNLDLIASIGTSDKINLDYFQKFMSAYKPQSIKEYDEIFDLSINVILNNFVNEKINQINSITIDNCCVINHVFTMNLTIALQIEQ